MRIKNGLIINMGLLVVVGLLLFTPLGFKAKVYVNRLISFNPTPVEQREQQVLEDYDWEVEELDGDVLVLNEMKGQVMLINFWASWCPPCVAEMPGFQELYSDYGDKVEFLFIARDQKDKVTRFLTRKEYDLPVYFERGLTPKILFNTALPTTYIIDGKGRIVMAEVGSRDWNGSDTRAFLDSVLSE
jgi:thiol-disulfide isomerase/thioredoxin